MKKIIRLHTDIHMNMNPSPQSGQTPFNQTPKEVPITLDPNNPDDMEIVTSLSEGAQEVRSAYPTPMDAVEHYRHGIIDPSYLSLGFSEEELEAIRAEGEKRNNDEAQK